MGAKHTAALIPLCHNILLSKVHVTLALVPEAAAVDVRAEATTVGPTGVEMEALTAAAVAALTVYDMCKVGGLCDLLCTLAACASARCSACCDEQPSAAAKRSSQQRCVVATPPERTASTW